MPAVVLATLATLAQVLPWPVPKHEPPRHVVVEADATPIEAELLRAIESRGQISILNDRELRSDPGPYLDLARLYEATGHNDRADEILRLGLIVAPGARDLAVALIALLKRHLQHERALAVAKEWIQREPSNPEPRVELAEVYLRYPTYILDERAGCIARGLAAADAALALRPGYVPALAVRRQLLAFKWIVSDREARPAIEAEQKALDAIYKPPPRVRSRALWPRWPPASASRIPSGRKPVRADVDVPAPACVACPAPAYPPAALRAWTQGLVYFQLVIDEKGQTIDVWTHAVDPVLERAAADALRTWRLAPTTVGGQSTPVVLAGDMAFRLTLAR